MTYWLTENSTIPMISGAILVVILLLMAFSARDRLLTLVAMVIAILTITVVVCERAIVTDQERITETLHVLADHVSNNNTDGILEYISQKNPQTSAKAINDMDRVNFMSCRLLGTNYFIGPESGNKQAEIGFVVVATGHLKGGQGGGTGNFEITLNLEEESEGNWKILKYKHEYAQAGAKL